MELRYYQRAAVDAVYKHLEEKATSPCVVIPTAGGKTPIIATIARDVAVNWGGRVLIVSSRKELVQQADKHLTNILDDQLIGVFSAGLGRKESDFKVVVGGVQSIVRAIEEIGRRDIMLVDEAHEIPPAGDGQYRTLIEGLREINPRMRVVGLTATPYRMATGPICRSDGVLNEICYEVGVRELIVKGYLSRLRSKDGGSINTSGLRIERGEYDARQAESAISGILVTALREIVERTKDRRHVLIFCQSINHSQLVANYLNNVKRDSAVSVTSESILRDAHITAFKRGEVKYCCNVGILTTGFDFPELDCVVLLRPTASPGLYYQMVGRGFRIAEGKDDCLVLDFGGNISRHGPVDAIVPKTKRIGEGSPPTKLCPECREVVPAAVSVCPDCGYEFPAREVSHDPKASRLAITSDLIEPETLTVRDVLYSKWVKRTDPTKPPTMRVDYVINMVRTVSEWVCFEHDGFARRNAVKWWSKRSKEPCPLTVERALDIASANGLADPTEIEIIEKPGERWPQIKSYNLGPIPEPVDVDMTEIDPEVPF